MPTYAPQPGASEVVSWENQRRQLRDTQATQLAQLQFQRGNTQQGQAVDTGRQAEDFARMRAHLPDAYNRRGLLGSGIQKRGAQDLQQQQDRGSYDLATQYQQMLGQLNLNESQINSQYTGGTASVDAIEAARRADLAAQIREML